MSIRPNKVTLVLLVIVGGLLMAIALMFVVAATATLRILSPPAGMP